MPPPTNVGHEPQPSVTSRCTVVPSPAGLGGLSSRRMTVKLTLLALGGTGMLNGAPCRFRLLGNWITAFCSAVTCTDTSRLFGVQLASRPVMVTGRRLGTAPGATCTPTCGCRYGVAVGVGVRVG